MKLSEITFKEQEKFEFLNPLTNESFEPKVTITILSTDSKTAKSNFLKAQREIAKMMKEDEKLDDEVLEAINKKYLSSLIVDFENIEDFKKVTEDAKIKLMENDIISKFVLDKSSKLGNFKTD